MKSTTYFALQRVDISKIPTKSMLREDKQSTLFTSSVSAPITCSAADAIDSSVSQSDGDRWWHVNVYNIC